MRPIRGEVASVAFDADWAIAREERHGDVVGFYHTHPRGAPEPSRRDVRTMRAWCGAFGKPLLCLIESAGDVAAYLFEDDESKGTRLEACELLPRGVVVVYAGAGRKRNRL